MTNRKADLSFLRVDEEYRLLLPPLSQPESEALKRSIREDGLHFPIIANKHGIVLDGHNRLKVCRELGIKPRFEVRDFSNDRLQEKKFVIVSNLRRRHLNDFQKIELSQPLLSMQRLLAKQRKIRAGRLFGSGRKRKLLPNGSKPSQGESVEKIAREIGLATPANTSTNTAPCKLAYPISQTRATKAFIFTAACFTSNARTCS